MPDINFIYNPGDMRSDAVHISQIGFRPDDPVKRAFLSCWMGSGGGLSFTHPEYFTVIDCKTDREVFQGDVTLSKAASDKTWAHGR